MDRHAKKRNETETDMKIKFPLMGIGKTQNGFPIIYGCERADSCGLVICRRENMFVCVMHWLGDISILFQRKKGLNAAYTVRNVGWIGNSV